MALIHMWLGPAEPQSCKRWLQGKFGGKAPEGMEFWQFVCFTKMTQSYWATDSLTPEHRNGQRWSEEWLGALQLCRGNRKTSNWLWGPDFVCPKIQAHALPMLCCFAGFQFEVRWIQVNRRKPKIWDGPWMWEVCALSELFSVSINIRSIVAFLGSSRIAPVALRFIILTSQFCKVGPSHSFLSILFSFYRFAFYVHLSFGSSWLDVSWRTSRPRWRYSSGRGWKTLGFANLACAQSVEQWFDSYFSDQRLAKCYIQAHIGSAMGISLV